MKAPALAALVVAAPAHAVAPQPCADSPRARCGTITVPAIRGDSSAGTMQISFRLLLTAP